MIFDFNKNFKEMSISEIEQAIGILFQQISLIKQRSNNSTEQKSQEYSNNVFIINENKKQSEISEIDEKLYKTARSLLNTLNKIEPEKFGEFQHIFEKKEYENLTKVVLEHENRKRPYFCEENHALENIIGNRFVLLYQCIRDCTFYAEDFSHPFFKQYAADTMVFADDILCGFDIKQEDFREYVLDRDEISFKEKITSHEFILKCFDEVISRRQPIDGWYLPDAELCVLSSSRDRKTGVADAKQHPCRISFKRNKTIIHGV